MTRRASRLLPARGDPHARDGQRRRFDEDALHAARRQAIADAVARELLWLLPTDRQAVVIVREGRAAVDLGPAPLPPPPAQEMRP